MIAATVSFTCVTLVTCAGALSTTVSASEVADSAGRVCGVRVGDSASVLLPGSDLATTVSAVEASSAAAGAVTPTSAVAVDCDAVVASALPEPESIAGEAVVGDEASALCSVARFAAGSEDAEMVS